jgi:putative addiction module killer protein
MLRVERTDEFDAWFADLADREARAKIAMRIDRLALGNAGDVAPVGAGVSEMRIHHGPGYRVYFVRRGQAVVVLLAGGTKRTQRRDIASAIALAKQFRP